MVLFNKTIFQCARYIRIHGKYVVERRRRKAEKFIVFFQLLFTSSYRLSSVRNITSLRHDRNYERNVESV